jgi:hypothetical protein
MDDLGTPMTEEPPQLIQLIQFKLPWDTQFYRINVHGRGPDAASRSGSPGWRGAMGAGVHTRGLSRNIQDAEQNWVP